MPARPVLLVPDARLKQPGARVEIFGDALRNLVLDLEDTRAQSPGCVGIAAPQIGAMLRVAIVDTSGHKKHGALSQGHQVLVNPTLVESEGAAVGREGCLSLPDFTANVRRFERVRIEFQDQDGIAASIEAEGFEAVVLQHELDHLDGILFLDRVSNLQTDVFPRKVRK